MSSWPSGVEWSGVWHSLGVAAASLCCGHCCLTHSHSRAPLRSNLARQTLQSWEHPIFTTFCLIWNYFLHFFYLSLQTFFKTISSKYLIAEQANIGLYCITRVTIFVDFFSFAFVSFSLTIFYHISNPVSPSRFPKDNCIYNWQLCWQNIIIYVFKSIFKMMHFQNQ